MELWTSQHSSTQIKALYLNMAAMCQIPSSKGLSLEEMPYYHWLINKGGEGVVDTIGGEADTLSIGEVGSCQTKESS